MNEEVQSNVPVRPFWRIRFTAPNREGTLVYKTLVYSAGDIMEAQRIAPERIRALIGLKPFRITSCTEF